MSRGAGHWQRAILRATSGAVAVAVSGIVRTTVVSPCRDDYTSARRAAKQLALNGQVAATYCHTCGRCLEIQDTEDRRRCCGPVRPVLAVVRPERRKLILHPASPPGGVAPVWVNAVIEPRSPGKLPVVELADLATLMLRRCHEQLEAGGADVSVADAVALTRLSWQVERDQAIPARDKALAELAEAQAAVLSLKDAVIRRSGQDEWRALWGEVQKERERAREIRRARQRFVTAARTVH